METNGESNKIAGALTFPANNNAVQPVPVQPRQPRNLQGLLRFAMETTKAEDAPGNSQFGPMDEERRKFLEEALKSLTIDTVEVLQKSIKVLTDSAAISGIKSDQEVPDDVKTAFRNAIELIYDIDSAKDFFKLGGFAVFPICYSCENEEVHALASELLAELCQNNPFCQTRALEAGFLDILLHLVEVHHGNVLAKTLYAISCLCREFEPACKVLVEHDGCKILISLLRNPEERVRVKAVFLIRYLCLHHEDAKEQFIQSNLVQTLVDIIKTREDDALEHVLHIFSGLIEDPRIVAKCKEAGLEEVLEKEMIRPKVQLDPELLGNCRTVVTALEVDR